jgi:uncharacterized RDD family membrane protein YckC
MRRAALQRFERARTTGVAASPRPRPVIDAESARGYAGPWRRAAAWIIEMIVVQSVIPALTIPSGSLPSYVDVKAVSPSFPALAFGVGAGALLFLVAVAGRTAGMIIMDLRVVRCDFRRPSVWEAVARYTLAALSIVTVRPMVLWGLRRVQPYERTSRKARERQRASGAGLAKGASP